MTAQNGAISLKAAGLVAADTNHTAVMTRASAFAIRFAWTACETASTDELYVVVVEANTAAATSTYTRIGTLFVGGHTNVIGGAGTTAATGEYMQAFYNPYGYQVRISTYVNGTIATGINFSADLFPIQTLQYP